MNLARRVVLIVGGLLFVAACVVPPEQLVLPNGVVGPYYAFRPVWSEGDQLPFVIPQLILRLAIIAVVTGVAFAVASPATVKK